ncbi:MAG TPA: hypothetical protein VKE74_06215, partial [Gemmataceae bacterium]|nr:hypothetical protein [Gemmataceae bacterium]
MPLSRCLSLVALFATGLTAFAADQPDRPPPHGQPAPAAGVPVPVAEFYTRMETKTAQAIKIQGMQINQKQEQTYYLRWTELAPDRGGNRRVRMRIDGVKLQLDIGGNVIE